MQYQIMNAEGNAVAEFITKSAALAYQKSGLVDGGLIHKKEDIDIAERLYQDLRYYQFGIIQDASIPLATACDNIIKDLESRYGDELIARVDPAL